MTGAEAIAEWLALSGIRHVWAVQGGTIAAVIDACERRADITVRYAANEISAGYACDGANRASGKLVAAALVCAGPGEAQLMPAIECAIADEVSMLAIAGEPRMGDDFQRRDWMFAFGINRMSLDAQLAVCNAETTWPIETTPTYTRRIPRCFLDWVDRVNPRPSARCREVLDNLVDSLPDDALFFGDTGVTLALTYRVLGARLGDRLHAPWSQAPMGAAIPMAAGAAAATGRACCAIVGDGSFDYQVQTLGTVASYDLPVRVVVLDNGGYEAIKMFQRAQGFDERGVGRRLTAKGMITVAANYERYVKVHDSRHWHEGDQ